MRVRCVICSDLFVDSENMSTTACGHVFHCTCLGQWIERSKSCPQCRSTVTKETTHRIYLQCLGTESEKESSLEDVLENLKCQVEIFESDMKRVESMNEKVCSLNEDLRDEVKTLKTTISEYEDKMNIMKFESQRSEMGRLQAEIARAKAVLILTEAEMNQMKTALALVELEQAQVEARKARLEAEKAKLEAEEARSHAMQVWEEVETARKEADHYRKEVERIRQDQEKASRWELRSTSERKANVVAEQIKSYQQEVTSLKSQLSSQVNLYKQLQKDLRRVRSEKELLDRKIKSLESNDPNSVSNKRRRCASLKVSTSSVINLRPVGRLNT